MYIFLIIDRNVTTSLTLKLSADLTAITYLDIFKNMTSNEATTRKIKSSRDCQNVAE